MIYLNADAIKFLVAKEGAMKGIVACTVIGYWVLVSSAQAEIFKCELNGKFVLQDVECPEGVEQKVFEVEIKNGKDRPKYSYQSLTEKRSGYDKSQFSPRDNELIESVRVEVGMSQAALILILILILVWGYPVIIRRSAYGP